MFDIAPPYLNSFGLLNAHSAEINSENTVLFSLEYSLLLRKSKRPYKWLMDRMLLHIQQCKTPLDGLYHQSPIRYGNKDDYMSPDQLISFSSTLFLMGKNDEVKKIHKYLKEHLYTYNNLRPGIIDFERTIQPMATSFVGVLAGRWISYPILVSSVIYACWSHPDESSGKLKAWVIMETLDMSWTKAICRLAIKRGKLDTWKGVFAEYFKEAAHPIRQYYRGIRE